MSREGFRTRSSKDKIRLAKLLSLFLNPILGRRNVVFEMTSSLPWGVIFDRSVFPSKWFREKRETISVHLFLPLSSLSFNTFFSAATISILFCPSLRLFFTPRGGQKKVNRWDQPRRKEEETFPSHPTFLLSQLLYFSSSSSADFFIFVPRKRSASFFSLSLFFVRAALCIYPACCNEEIAGIAPYVFCLE